MDEKEFELSRFIIKDSNLPYAVLPVFSVKTCFRMFLKRIGTEKGKGYISQKTIMRELNSLLGAELI